MMDPTTTLNEIRELVSHPLSGDNDWEQQFEKLSGLIEALDGWMSRAGSLPEQWKRIGEKK